MALPACRTDGPLANQLQGVRDGLHLVGREVWIATVVDGRLKSGDNRSHKRVAISGQPGGMRDHRRLPDNQPAGSNGIGTQTGGSPAGNRERRFGLRLLDLPQGDQAREVVGAPTAVDSGGELQMPLHNDTRAGLRAQVC